MANFSNDIKDAETLRSLDIVIDSWENDDLSLSEMTSQLQAVNNIASGNSNLASFLKSTNLHSREKLH